MVLKFKVWRLQYEQHIRKVTEDGKTFLKKVPVLVRRDKEGHIRFIAKNKWEEKLQWQWWERYNKKNTLEQLLAIRKLKEHIRKVKASVRKRGFVKQISLYGIFQEYLCPKCNSKDIHHTSVINEMKVFACAKCGAVFTEEERKKGKRFYNRYEIFKASKWTQEEVSALHGFIKDSKPVSEAGVFMYHEGQLLIDPSDKVTRMGTKTVGYVGAK